MIFDEIETGKVYERNPFYQGPSTSSSYADAESDRMAISENTTDEFTWQSSLMERNNDGLSPAREGGLTSDQDFALANYKMFKVAAGQDAEVHHHQLQRTHGPDANRAGARTVEIR